MIASTSRIAASKQNTDVVKRSRHAIYRLFKSRSGFCLSLVPSGPITHARVRMDRPVKQTPQQTNKQT